MYIKHTVLNIIILFMLTFLVSCSTGGKTGSAISKMFKGNRMLPEGTGRVYLEIISENDIDSSIRDALLESVTMKINTSQQLSLVDTRDAGDLVVKVMLTGFFSDPVKFNSSGVVVLKKIRIDSLVWLTATATGEEKLRNKKVESEMFYSDVDPPVLSEYKALTVLTDLHADRVVSVISTGWYLDNRNNN